MLVSDCQQPARPWVSPLRQLAAMTNRIKKKFYESSAFSAVLYTIMCIGKLVVCVAVVLLSVYTKVSMHLSKSHHLALLLCHHLLQEFVVILID